MNSLAKRFLALFVACLAFGPAMADEFDRHVADLFILQAKPIQHELGITEAQRARMNQAAAADEKRKEAYHKELEKTKSQPSKSRVFALYRQLKTEVFNQLSEAQLRRLREISLQHIGVVALGDPVVGKRLGLSSAQVQRIQGMVKNDAQTLSKTERQLREPVVARFKGKAQTEENRRKFEQEVYNAVAPRLKEMEVKDHDQILSVLTPAQKSAWKALQGRPFTPPRQ